VDVQPAVAEHGGEVGADDGHALVQVVFGLREPDPTQVADDRAQERGVDAARLSALPRGPATTARVADPVLLWVLP
jgi:hypothetical protein